MNKQALMTRDGPLNPSQMIALAIIFIINDGAITLFRTSDPEEIASFNGVLIDVGGQYDPDQLKFDYHGIDKRGPTGLRYSSAGLVWEAYAEAIIGKYAALLQVDPDYERVKMNVYMSVTAHIDTFAHGEFPKGYNIATLWTVLNLFNPQPLIDEKLEPTLIEAEDAIAQTAHIFGLFVKRAMSDVLVEDVVKTAERMYDGQVVLFKRYVAPECMLMVDPVAIFTVHPFGDHWVVRPVPSGCQIKGEYPYKKPMPTNWVGLKGEELHLATSVAGVLSCTPHEAAVDTEEHALALAINAVSSIY